MLCRKYQNDLATGNLDRIIGNGYFTRWVLKWYPILQQTWHPGTDLGVPQYSQVVCDCSSRRSCQWSSWSVTSVTDAPPSAAENNEGWWKSIIKCYVNSLAPGRSECDLKNVIFNLVLLIGIFSSHDNALRWMPQDLTDDKSTLVQVMAWCRQATSHYLSRCWLSSLLPYGVSRPQWVNSCNSDEILRRYNAKLL